MANVLRICPGEVADDRNAFFSRFDVMISRSDRIGFKMIGHVDLSLLGINVEKRKKTKDIEHSSVETISSL